MLLKDILARELKAWPECSPFAWQDYDREVRFRMARDRNFCASELAEDNIRFRGELNPEQGVTRAEWQAAVEALKAEQAAELKWPDGAEFSGCGVVGIFYRNVKPGQFERWSSNESKWFTFNGSPMYTPLIPRPTEHAVEWDGVGLPPVGKSICEYLGARQFDLWTVVDVIAIWGEGNNTTVFVDYGDGLRAEKDPKRFRPVRTQEQIAAEERERAINEMVYGACGFEKCDGITTAAIICGQLYDANYRKQPE